MKRPAATSTSAQIFASIDDLLKQVFVRLPLKQLCRFKSVSKHWDSIISDQIWSKVCIVTRSDIDWFGIYILDLTKKSCVDDFTAFSPTIRINCEYFFDAAFCVLGSTLYAFQGFDNDWDTPTRRCKERGNKSAYTYELSSSEVGLKLEKRMMQKISDMHYPKYGTPIAMPTLDGKKILLFSSIIKFDIPLSDKCDFELYNPATGKWKMLPGISRPLHEFTFLSDINILSYTFTRKTVLLIHTQVGSYSLDFGVKGGGCWERLCARPVPVCGGHFVMIGRDLCLTPTRPFVLHLYDDGDGGGKWKRFHYPELTYLPHDPDSSRDLKYPPQPDVTTSITSIALDDDSFLFCILQTGIDSTQPHLTLDLCTLNLPDCIDKLKLMKRNRNLPGTTIVKSFKFFIENQLPIDSFYPVFFSFIPPPIAL